MFKEGGAGLKKGGGVFKEGGGGGGKEMKVL